MSTSGSPEGDGSTETTSRTASGTREGGDGRVEGRMGRRGATSVLRTFSSFRNRNYRLYWFGQLFSVTGTWVQRIAQAWLVLKLTDSSFALGLVSTLQFLPITFLSMFGGVLADRLPKRSVLVATQSIMAVQALILGILISTGLVQVWHIYIMAGALGFASAFDNPTRQAFVVEMVGPKDVPNAVALNSSLFNAARIVGPSLGGALIGIFGIAVPFYVNAVSYLAVIGGLLMMRPADFHDVPRPARGPVLARLREGISFSARTPQVALVLILMGFLGTFGYQFTVLLPLVAKYVLGTGALGFGGLLTAMGVGSLVAALWIAYLSRPSEKVLLIGAFSFTILLGALGLSTTIPITVGILVLLGVASITFTATANSRLQLLAPGELRGRVMSLYIFVFSGTAPLGSFTIGLIAQSFSVRAAIAFMTSLCLLGLLLGWLYRARHGGPEPTPVNTTASPRSETARVHET